MAFQSPAFSEALPRRLIIVVLTFDSSMDAGSVGNDVAAGHAFVPSCWPCDESRRGRSSRLSSPSPASTPLAAACSATVVASEPDVPVRICEGMSELVARSGRVSASEARRAPRDGSVSSSNDPCNRELSSPSRSASESHASSSTDSVSE